MKKALNKDFRIEIKKSFSRFISILLIVVLGVAFYSGIRSSMPAMKATADATYDRQNLMDIRVLGTMGLTQGDVDALSNVEGVSGVEGSYSTDFLCYANSSEFVTKVISMPKKINDIEIVDGRYPEKYNETVVSIEFLKSTGYKIGDEISLVASEKNESVFDTLASDKYTIVGVFSSSYFLNGELGTSTIGDGTVDGCAIIPLEAFVTDIFTEIHITVDGASELDCYSDEYKNKVNSVIDNIKTISNKQCDIRFSEIRSKSSEMLEKARNEFYEAEAKAKTELAEASQKILDNQNLLAEKRALLEEQKALLDVSKAEIPQKKQELEQKKKELIEAEKQLANEEVKLKDGKVKLEETKNKIVEAEKLYELMLQDPNADKKEIDDAKNTIALLKGLYIVNEKEYNNGESQFIKAKQQIEDGKKEIEKYEALLNNTDDLSEAERQLADAEAKLQEYELELQKGSEEYEIKKQDAEAELADARIELEKAESKINNMKTPDWHVLDRSTVESYISFENDSESIGAIGTVFPIIFFLVAALVSLTTMTRMVEEQRTQIGTLKALGYSKLSIAKKYILYALYASVLGSVIGVVLGEYTLPYFIVTAYKTVYYNLGESVVNFNVVHGLTAAFAATFCTTFAAFFACYKELHSVPAELMRPVAPKSGKRIFLEKIPAIWERLNFGQKAAARNLFRYKKRLFMTLFGVGGCMALLLVGMGIKDSVSSMAYNQYGDVFKYDSIVSINSNLTRSERRTMLNNIKDISDINDYMVSGRTMIYSSNSSENSDDGNKTAYMIVPGNAENLNQYVKLTERTGERQSFNLTNDGVIITEKYAKALKVKIGDSIYIKLSESDSNPKEVKVTGITENYIFNYVYMTPALYQSIYQESPHANMLMVKIKDGTNLNDLSSRLLKIKGVTSVSMFQDDIDSLNNVMGMLYMIIALMIVAAGLLAFVVIYNLNNINISERRRELATIKLLGFYNKETAIYVYRENFILTLLGIVLGVFLGIGLHRYVMTTIETDMYMFGRELNPWSIVIGVILTVLFAILVNLAMYVKVKKIDMVESLKSVE